MGASDKASELDFDALLRSTAVDTFGRDDLHQVLLGDMAQGLARMSSLDSLPPSVIHGNSIAPEFRDVPLGDVLGAVVAQQTTVSQMQEPVQSTLNVAQCMDIWAREIQMGADRNQSHGRPVIMSGSVLPLRTEDPLQTAAATTTTATTATAYEGRQMTTGQSTSISDGREKRQSRVIRRRMTDTSQESGKGRRATKEDERSVRNRESAAKSRKKRQQYTNELERRVKMLKDTNKELRKKIICAAKAPPDPYAGMLEGKKLRRTRTMPL